MNLTKAIRNLEHQARKAEKLAKVEQSKADTLREKLESIQRLVGMLGSFKTAVPKARRRRKGKMSAAGRARIAAAQKKRWAAWKTKKGAKTAKKVVRKAKRKMSPEGRARIVAALKARWAKQKAAN